ncbi:conserved hypothetical protein [Gloeothece citriformis PCC 7424]|uniref:Nucleotide exchange factor GrpE n=2 Tax=Gloeothece TaxID=28070 RepID=B7KJ11_GLOC7|nr:conserved hypothetical protein [Gloeothece citriformis PCC 7424]
MFTDWQDTFENWFPLLKEKREAENLALQAEEIVRQLNSLPPVDTDNRDIITVLKSVCLLLERFQEHSEQLIQEHGEQVNQKESVISPPVEVIQTEDVPSSTELPSPPPIRRETPEEKPSITAQELMRLRDWVLLANSGEGEEKASPKVLEAIYKQLGKILEKEGITSLEKTGSFNYEKQQVVSTQATNDPEKEDLIYDTVRPGYLFHERLIRPQEVIVYTYDTSLATPEVS